MILKNLTLVLILASCITSTSCAPKIKNFDKYQKQFLSKTEFMPSKEALKSKQPKIVVFTLDENDNKIATQSHLGNSIANNIENILAKNRLAELVDRKANKKLKKEITLSEMKKTGSYKGPIVADYAISGTISNAGFISKYSTGKTYFNPKNAQMVSIPPKYKYSSDVAGNIKIYELPALTVIETIEFAGKRSRSENVQQKGGFSMGGIQIGGEKSKGASRDDSLVRKAGEDAVDNIKISLKNAFAKKGYILEKRTLNKKTIFKITLGSRDGIKIGDKFEITGQYEVENPITNQIDIERRIIASGVVSDKINAKTAWVLIKNKDHIGSIRLGDSLQIKYKKGRFADVTKIAKSFTQ